MVEEFVPLLPDEHIALASGAVAHGWTERIVHVGDDVEVLDTYADGDLAGAPAVTRRRLAAGGSATYVSADIGRDGVRAVLTGLELNALAGDPRSAEGRLDVIERGDGEARYVFLSNRTDDEVAAPVAGDVLVGAAAASGVVTVPPRSAVVVRVAR